MVMMSLMCTKNESKRFDALAGSNDTVVVLVDTFLEETDEVDL